MVILTHNMLDVSKYNLNTIYIFYVIVKKKFIAIFISKSQLVTITVHSH